MSAGLVHVLQPGLHTTVQDLGRWGFQAFGVSVAGPMDPFSHRLANALVGNDRRAATLEVTLTGPELEFEDERLVAVAGARFDLRAGGAAVPHEAPFVVPRRGSLKFGHRHQGARAYVAVAGGIDVPPAFGSRATHVPSGLGGFHGRPLLRGDRLLLQGFSEHDAQSKTALGAPFLRDWPIDRFRSSIRVLRNDAAGCFRHDALDVLQSASYAISADSDRMGYRLAGAPLTHAGPPDILSEPTPIGSVQVPGSGQPILLMADRQTTGGYAAIATAISADIGAAGQLAPGDAITFRVCSRLDAVTALIQAEQMLLAAGERDV